MATARATVKSSSSSATAQKREPQKSKASPPQASEIARKEPDVLPVERRHRLPTRMDELLAHPRAARCPKPCTTCAEMPEPVAEAVLFAWDTLARSGVWPIRGTAITKLLRANEFPVKSRHAIERLINHRRWNVLKRIIQAEIKAYKREQTATPVS